MPALTWARVPAYYLALIHFDAAVERKRSPLEPALRSLDGLCKILSLDMRVIDPAWIGMKLRKLLNFPEPLGDFMAFVPGSRKQQNWPSTVSYVARLIIHRYAMLGILDEEGYPVQTMGVLESPVPGSAPKMKGMKCPECSNYAVIRKDGCDFCSACGWVGVCG